ncbi:hypothetical protein [Phaeobacter sp. 22II1-1F12B]|uniref:hypothetical protein n=1 Tax=Phaeobacter sp. 22II1-1F12B TaxID=1317111 RepID=UPI000B526705|nr:hypothetical protein [Phaeobacter sp. 22II1-1F12B]
MPTETLNHPKTRKFFRHGHYIGKFALLCGLALPLPAAAQEKLAEDPTKVVTRIGAQYSDELTISGSLAFGPATKINARVSESGQWSLGGSYLFSFGIVNVAAGKNEFDNGSVQTRYSIGSFIPLSALGLKTGTWQVFTAFGYGYTEGNVASFDLDISEYVLVPISSNSGYLGLFAIKPLNEKLTFMTVGLGTKGSDDYSGYSVGAGLSYHLSDRDTVSAFATYVDNTFGEEEKLTIGYRREF